jgi:threonine dehydrogenase-like Zn-dependent dehydrogenase
LSRRNAGVTFYANGLQEPNIARTHHFKLDKILDAYDTFGAAAKTNALKVLIEA